MHTDETNLKRVSNQSVNCRFSILNHSKWTYTKGTSKELISTSFIHEAKWIILNQKSVKSISRQGFIFSYFKKMISEGGTAEIWNGSNRALFCYFFNFQTKALSLSICLLEIFWPEKNSFTFMRLFRLWTLYIWATTTSGLHCLNQRLEQPALPALR